MPRATSFRYTYLYLNGLANSLNTHVAVLVCTEPSDHDHKLKFPARFTITLELLNQHRDQDHYKKKIQCNMTRENISSNECGDEQIGCNYKFISHADLEWNEDKQTQYLKNDCLKFRITKIVMN